MTSVILSTATRYLLPLLLLLSVYLLLHGHNVPGGGFAGGLVASAAFALYTIAHGSHSAQKILHIHPRTLIGVGLITVLLSGCLALFNAEPFLTAIWSQVKIPFLGKIGTPIVFDTGVYLVVIGVILTIIFSLAEE